MMNDSARWRCCTGAINKIQPVVPYYYQSMLYTLESLVEKKFSPHLMT